MENRNAPNERQASDQHFRVNAPQITLPKGGGAISGIGEKLTSNPATGTGSMSVPIFASPGRSGFGPELTLSYDSGAGNGPFGFGWNLSVPSITRRTDRGLPKYLDTEESDTFVLSGAEDLVPVLVKGNDGWKRETFESPASNPGYVVHRYRPRIESLFARIERWTHKKTGVSHWRSISKENVTTLYGKHDDARIADPADPTRIFSWLICESYDDKGNTIIYHYKPEDAANVNPRAPYERNRLNAKHLAQRYLKNIRYGNRAPRKAREDLSLRDDWLFELVFDYGEDHITTLPADADGRQLVAASLDGLVPWPVRQDPFSLFRSTFELRTHRLCHRVLMFHHFPDELGGTKNYLVRSTDFEYKQSSAASFISSITQTGYVLKEDENYFRRALPRLEFRYTDVQVDETIHEIDSESIKNLPNGVDGGHYQWVDLDSEGLAGVLTEQTDIWFYKRNLGNGTFGALEKVRSKPSLSALNGGQQQLFDLAGEGRLDLVQYDGPMAGFYKRNSDGWDPFTSFKAIPNVNTRDSNLRFVDITGNGHPDILISEDTVFTWCEALGINGFAPARLSPKSWDEEKGPTLVFSDPTQSIFLADMAGDGLSDIVRIRCSDICYWPNLGYGRFGAKVTMGNTPVFESPDLFDPRRIHLADIDGSGNSDIIYVGSEGISLYFNQSGNFWSPPHRLSHFPKVNNLTSIAAMDLLGNGTACLVWSSPLASDAGRPMGYIDLMGGQKPHLLVYATNNLGAETEVRYKASTKFYLQDREAGSPWVTKLPFPVHVIEQVTNRDLVSNTKLVTTYRYRHGYYDGVEREFRGFAYVERCDAETAIGKFELPPIVTKTWFHNGAFLEEGKLEAYFKDPANREFFTGDAQAAFLPDTEFPADLTAEEMREAARALKGSILRQEIYANDAPTNVPKSDPAVLKASRPYSVSERSYKLNCLQPQGPNRHAVFFSHPSETIDYHYERNPADPRINHALTIAIDDYGNVLKSAAIGYQRRSPAFDDQRKTLATLTESDYTNPILEDDAYRSPLQAELRTYELAAPELEGAIKPLDLSAVEGITTAATAIAPEARPTSGQTQKRLIERLRTLYRRNDLSACLPLGKLESMALPCESYKLALTPGLLDIFQTNASRADLTAALVSSEGGYRNLDGDGRLWIASGQVFYSPTLGDPAPSERTFAQAHFFLPHRYQDPFSNTTIVTYDTKYSLLLISTRDAVGNETSAEHDYRVLLPKMITDPNDNRTEACFDALGMLVGTAVRGKAAGPVEGDSLDDFITNLTPAQIKDFFGANDPRQRAINYLGKATTRILYDLERLPVCAASIAREKHESDLRGVQTKVQLRFAYSDGFGREAQTKVQAEPGPLDLSDPNSPDANPRWVGTGEKVYNNKGKPVRQYEPFFSATPHFSIEKWGVSSTLFYDPLGRVVATLHPNDTFEKVIFDPWQQTNFDVNDTVILDPKTDRDVGEFFTRLSDAEYLPTWYQQRISGAKGPDEKDAAEKAAKHASTPTIAHLDSLGRTFLTIADNGKDAIGNDQKYATSVVLDIEGNQREVIDPLGRLVMLYDYDMLGTRIHQASMEAGERWMLNDGTGKPILAWNSRKYAFRNEYDALRRPVRCFVQGGNPAEPNSEFFPQAILFERTIYGDSTESGLNDAQQKQSNLRTKAFKHFDGAGVITTDLYDFKGNLLRSVRQLASDYKNPPDWSQNPLLDGETFFTAVAYDALNRVIETKTPDKSIYRPRYNEANLLEKVDVNLRGESANGQPEWTHLVTNTEHDAKGQRTMIQYGNGGRTAYDYDPTTFRLIRQKTTRAMDNSVLQDLSYTYDPAGNITRIIDGAQQTIYFRNKRVEPSADYTYDPIYRLIEARGREHLGQGGGAPFPHSYNDATRAGLLHPGDGNAMGRYIERYQYDAVGNFLKMQHLSSETPGPGLTPPSWSRGYSYTEASLLQPHNNSNRLSSTMVGNASVRERYAYDVHGNMLQMPQLRNMNWNFKDQLQMTCRQAVNVADADFVMHQGERTYYVYDSAGQRVRKVTELSAVEAKVKDHRIYLNGFEMYHRNGANPLVRETLHIMDDKQRVALLETRTRGIDGSPAQLIRYQLSNHLGSVSLELDNQAQIISYEEYTPYGSTSYQAVRNQTEAPKRYRYTAKERDEESGFTYHGARYYAPWLGRWTSCDPLKTAAGPNSFAYVRGNPIRRCDNDGRADDELKATFNYVQKLADLIPQNEFAGIKPGPAGQRAHLTLESALTFGWEIEGTGANIQRLAQEVMIDNRGIIRAVGVDPGSFGPAAEGWHSIDIAFLKEEVFHVQGAKGTSNLIGQSAREVVQLGGDYKTGLAKLKNVAEVQEMIGAPYLKLSRGGDFSATADAALAKASIVKPGQATSSVVEGGLPAGLQRAAAWATETVPKALKIAGEVLTVAGASSEAAETVRLLREQNQGTLTQFANFSTVFVLGIAVGVVDDAFAAAEIASSGAPNITEGSWEQHGAGPLQHALGEAYRGILDWGYRGGI